ncbi:hypothetical protein BDC45DRAFT_554541 [Circinella umbellata]|nr:hypothetical protein BDC45DRAFT_554541 [Circinella umbellata]
MCGEAGIPNRKNHLLDPRKPLVGEQQEQQYSDCQTASQRASAQYEEAVFYPCLPGTTSISDHHSSPSQQEQHQLIQDSTTNSTTNTNYLDASFPSTQRMSLPPLVGKDLSSRRHQQQRFQPYPQYHPKQRNYQQQSPKSTSSSFSSSSPSSFRQDDYYSQQQQQQQKQQEIKNKPATTSKVKEPDKYLDLFHDIPEQPSVWYNITSTTSFQETLCDDDTIFSEFAQLTADNNTTSPSMSCFDESFSLDDSCNDDDFVLFS